jgi:hypothetical protein
MRKLVAIVTATTALLLAGELASHAQTSRGAANIHAQNFTPIEKAACGPFFGARCGPYHRWVCGPYGRCWCAQC